MAVQESTPIWADAMFADLEGAKSFYGDVLGWTFGESATEFGNYTEARAGGKAVAAVVPPMPGAEDQSAWCLYLATTDTAATVARVREHGGEVLMEPMRVSDFGTMALVRDPSGVAFGLWEPGSHQGFEATGVPGAYCWAEIYTREPAKADAFFTGVFGYRPRRMESGPYDFLLFDAGDTTVLGRMAMTDDFPAEVPPHINVYFTVEDCDAAIDRATARGGVVRFGPMSSPFGRFATLSDPQGAVFSVIDVTTTEGEMPETTPVE
ncbi:VOC family protein [Streptomyces sp. LP05-1]|uniref:VOC family protein n=1 Tax=Streptomyces pyxinae TaxID=2970734 RepID=A0ABT2CEK4_9ACTN|nr:VOC family protein [Streptomyces sp. LP05-1]MCS0635074.1 VOC family protein [Streptomyces sp. LP05-1]